jgi:hypothetical protein
MELDPDQFQTKLTLVVEEQINAALGIWI